MGHLGIRAIVAKEHAEPQTSTNQQKMMSRWLGQLEQHPLDFPADITKHA